MCFNTFYSYIIHLLIKYFDAHCEDVKIGKFIFTIYIDNTSNKNIK